MADENNPNVQQGKKITVKLKPLALEKATGEQAANVNIPAAPAGASASATVKFDKKAVAASEPEMPTAQDLAKQTIKLTPPPKTGLPKPPVPMPAVAPKKATQVVKPVVTEPAVAATPTLKKATQVVKPVDPVPSPSAATVPDAPPAASTQAVKKPGLSLPKTNPAPTPVPAPSPSAPTVPDAPSAASTQAVKKPGLSLPKTNPAPTPVPAGSAEAEPPAEAVKKPGLVLPKTEPAPAPAAPAPAPETPAPAPAMSDADAKRVQEEGLKPKEGGSGLGLKKVEKVAEEDLPDSLKQDAAMSNLSAGKIKLKGPADEPGPVFTAIVVLAFVVLLIGVYVQFFSYAKWMPEMDAHINSLPAPPTGVFPK